MEIIEGLKFYKVRKLRKDTLGAIPDNISDQITKFIYGPVSWATHDLQIVRAKVFNDL